MKLNFSLKKKEFDIEANVEDVIVKGMEITSKKEPRKTRYQIRQEEIRKRKEQEHQHEIRKMRLLFAALGILFAIIIIMSFLEK